MAILIEIEKIFEDKDLVKVKFTRDIFDQHNNKVYFGEGYMTFFKLSNTFTLDKDNTDKEFFKDNNQTKNLVFSKLLKLNESHGKLGYPFPRIMDYAA